LAFFRDFPRKSPMESGENFIRKSPRHSTYLTARAQPRPEPGSLIPPTAAPRKMTLLFLLARATLAASFRVVRITNPFIEGETHA
jgi:hypothetical protein